VRRRASTVPLCQSLQLAVRIDVPTPAPVVGNVVCFFELLEPPQPPSSAAQQISAAAWRVVRCERRATALTAS
jgi:hypothetical protein